MALKEWVLQFNLAAKQDSNFSSTFKAAQSALVETQNRIQQLNKVQSDITAYQKQQQAVDSTKQRLAVLQQQYDNIQKEIQETEGYSSALENKLISKQAQIDKTTTSLHTYEQRLAATGNTLREAGVDTTQLTAETTRLETEVDKLKDQQVDLKKTMDEAGEEATGDVYLYRYREVDGEPTLENIDDDEEYEIAADAFDEWMDEQEFEELPDME